MNSGKKVTKMDNASQHLSQQNSKKGTKTEVKLLS